MNSDMRLFGKSIDHCIVIFYTTIHSQCTIDYIIAVDGLFVSSFNGEQSDIFPQSGSHLPTKHCGNHDKLLVELLLAIRKDIKIAIKDDPDTFKFHLVGSSPKD